MDTRRLPVEASDKMSSPTVGIRVGSILSLCERPLVRVQSGLRYRLLTTFAVVLRLPSALSAWPQRAQASSSTDGASGIQRSCRLPKRLG